MPGVEALHVADLEHLAGALRRRACSALHLLDGDAERLLAEHVLAGLERRDRRPATWKASDGGDDHGLDVGVGEHRRRSRRRTLAGAVRRGHALAQVVGARRRSRRGRRCAPWRSSRNAPPGRSGRSRARRRGAAGLPCSASGPPRPGSSICRGGGRRLKPGSGIAPAGRPPTTSGSWCPTCCCRG